MWHRRKRVTGLALLVALLVLPFAGYASERDTTAAEERSTTEAEERTTTDAEERDRGAAEQRQSGSSEERETGQTYERDEERELDQDPDGRPAAPGRTGGAEGGERRGAPTPPQ